MESMRKEKQISVMRKRSTKDSDGSYTEKYDLLILTGLCFLFQSYKIVYSLIFANPGLQTAQDLFSLIYSSAHLAGKDWSAVGYEHSAYYGYGFVMLFSWLYRIMNDGLVIYRIILVCCNLLNVVSCVLCYQIAKRFKLPINKYLLFLICIACSSVVGTNEGSITNEQPLRVCVWAVLYILIKLCDLDIIRRQRIKHTMMLGGILVYSCMVHARAVVLYVLVAFCVIVVFIRRKKFLVNIPTILCMSILYIPYKIYTNYLQMQLLGEINANSSIVAKAANGMRHAFSWDRVGSFILSVIMYLQEWNVLTCGIATIGLSVICYRFYFYIKEHNPDSEQTDRFICGFTYSLCGVGAFLIGICWSEREEIYRGVTTMQDNEFLRMLTLVRYFAPFIAPFLLLVILLLISCDRKGCKDISRWSLILLIALNVSFLFIVYPKVRHTGWATAVFLPFTWDVKMDTGAIYLVGSIMIPLIFGLLSIWQIRKRNWYILCALLILLSTRIQLYNYVHLRTKSTASMQYEMVDGGYQYLKKDSQTENIYIVIDEAEGVDKTTYYYLYQLLLPDIHMIPGNPPEGAEEGMILTNNPAVITNPNAYEVSQLDENEWLLKKNEP